MLVDQYGNPLKVATRSYQLPQDYTNRGTVKKHAYDAMAMIDRKRWEELINSSRMIVNSFSEVSFAVQQKAELSNSFIPKYKGKNRSWGDEAQSFLRSYFDSDIDVRGMPWNWFIDIEIMSMLIDIDGEVFYLNTRIKDEPKLQFLEAHRVGNRNNSVEQVKDGRYAGRNCRNGIVYNEYGKELAYKVLGDTEAQDRYIPSSTLKRVAKPRWFSEGRGVTTLASNVLDWMDIKETREAEKISQKLNSRLSLLHKNETGLPSALNPRSNTATDESGATVTTEVMNDGQILYIKANGDVSAHESQRPSQNWREFDKMIRRGAFAALGWRVEMLDPTEMGSGAAARSIMEQINKTIQKRWKLIYPYAQNIVRHTIAVSIENGTLPDDPDWYAWGFNKPRELTVDEGRMRAADLADLRAGVTSMKRIVEKYDADIDDILAENEEYLLKKKAVAQRNGWNEGELGVWGHPGDTAAVLDKDSIEQMKA